jgi:hypothetical protein
MRLGFKDWMGVLFLERLPKNLPNLIIVAAGVAGPRRVILNVPLIKSAECFVGVRGEALPRRRKLKRAVVGRQNRCKQTGNGSRRLGEWKLGLQAVADLECDPVCSV